MGAGKSTIGPRLAQRLGWSFIDLDDEIVRTEQQSIAEIFDSIGEARFRELEQNALADYLASGKYCSGARAAAPLKPRLTGSAFSKTTRLCCSTWPRRWRY